MHTRTFWEPLLDRLFPGKSEQSVQGTDNPVQIFRASLARVKKHRNFYKRFYQNFMSSSEEIAFLFRNKNMRQIERKLAMTLDMVCDSTGSEPGFAIYLQMLGKVHSKLDIAPKHFDLWRQALMQTVQECDKQFDEETRLAWNQVIDELMEKMKVSAD